MNNFCNKQVSMSVVIALVVVGIIAGFIIGKCAAKHKYGYSGYGEKHQMMKDKMKGHKMMMEGESMEEEMMSAKIAGTWQSMDDAMSVVKYNSDGSMVDVYDGEALGTGTWSLSGDNATLTTTTNGEEYTYTVQELDDTQLIMMYEGRGNILKYSRVTAGE